MFSIPGKNLEEFIAAARLAAQHRLALCGSGNLSRRIDNGHMLITATGSWMSELSPEDIAVCKISDGISLNGKEPSMEIKLHRAILSEYPDINVVLHFQSPCATMLACSKAGMKNYYVIPEIPFHIGAVGELPYMNPGSEALSAAVTKKIADYSLVILKNHGQVAVGGNFRESFQRAIFFEFASEILLRLGDRTQFLSDEDVALLLSKYKAGKQ